MDVVDKIRITIQHHSKVDPVTNNFKEYICRGTLCEELVLVDEIVDKKKIHADLVEGIEIDVLIEKINSSN